MIGKDATSVMFVNGQWDKAAILSSRLSLLMPLASLETDVTYMCQVSALPKNGSLEGLDSFLEITEKGDFNVLILKVSTCISIIDVLCK